VKIDFVVIECFVVGLETKNKRKKDEFIPIDELRAYLYLY